LSIETRHHRPNPVGRFDALKKRIVTRTKNVSLVAKDEKEIKKLGEKLNHALEDFHVRIVISRHRTFLLIGLVRSTLRSALSLDSRYQTRIQR
jgi:hypothetical protein